MKVTRATAFKQKPTDESALGFGKLFTDHMLVMDYQDGAWGAPEIVPYENFSLSPACSALHYGQSIFEGLKAYRQPDGGIALFRPSNNFARMNLSAKRICMPALDGGVCLEGLKQLIDLERDWVPKTPGTSLYIRPTMIANDDMLGVHAAHCYRFFIILSPVGAYYAEGLKPIKIFVENEYVRAVKGGIGFAKTAGNYAASILAGHAAGQKGYSQVLWLDGKERKYVEEVGAMNIFFVIGDTLVTPELSGSILPGITRDSVLTLAAEKGLKVQERAIAIQEVFDAAEAGTLKECFGSGTAAVISPVSHLDWDGKVITVADGNMGSVASHLYDTLTGTQNGLVPDTHGWMVRI